MPDDYLMERAGFPPHHCKNAERFAPFDACLRWKQGAIFMGHTLQGLGAILEILDAAVADEADEDGDRMLATHLLSGLVPAGRNLVRSAESGWKLPDPSKDSSLRVVTQSATALVPASLQ